MALSPVARVFKGPYQIQFGSMRERPVLKNGKNNKGKRGNLLVGGHRSRFHVCPSNELHVSSKLDAGATFCASLYYCNKEDHPLSFHAAMKLVSFSKPTRIRKFKS